MTGLLIRRDTAIPVVVATVLFGVSLRPGVPSSLAVLAGVLILGIAIYPARRQGLSLPNPRTTETTLLAAILIFAAATAVGWPPRGIGRTSEALEILPALVWAALALFVFLRGDAASKLTRSAIVLTTIAFTGLIGAIHIGATDGVGLDVLALHVEAADALRDGNNPYTDAVTVADGAPTAQPGDTIDGYLYPPITGLLYSLGKWTTPDPRYTSLAGWLVFLSVLGLCAVRRQGRRTLLIVLFMAAMPGWPIVLRAAWTEPVSLALAALAFLYWRRPVVSGIFLGSTLGSKQYFFVAAPLLALYRDSRWLKRTILAALVIVTTVGAALLWDFSAFWSAAVEFHMTTQPRPDSQNLVGLLASLGVNWEVPSFVPIVVGLLASIFSAVWARTRVQWFLALAFTLAISFVASSQAFPNYWFLIAGLCGVTLLDMTSSYVSSGADEHLINANETLSTSSHNRSSSAL